jgi:hypothetical protein
MIKIFLLFIICIVINSSWASAQQLITDAAQFNQQLDSLIQGSYTSVYSFEEIPKKIRRGINTIHKSKFKIANPSKPYNSSDALINSHLPNRCLIYVSKSDKFYIITYLLGGYTTNTRSILIRYSKQKILWAIAFVPPSHTDFEQLMELIKKHKDLFVLKSDIL